MDKNYNYEMDNICQKIRVKHLNAMNRKSQIK